MKAIILVAGECKRTKTLTDKPKCLLEIAGISILENALTCLSQEGFREVILVVGYRAELIKEFGSSFKGMKLTYINNPIYKTTNNMYSLYLARRYLRGGVLIFDGDILFEQRVLQRVLEGEEDCWAVDNFKDFDGAILTADQLGKIVKIEIIQEISTFPQRYKSAGIIKVSPELGTKLASWLHEDVEKGDTNIYNDIVLARRLDKHPIYICNVSGLKWAEIDTEEDYRRAQALFG